MMYYQPQIISKEKAEQNFKENDPEIIMNSLLDAVYNLDDSEWLEDKCLELCSHQNSYVVKTVVISFGHIARIHGSLSLEKVLPVISELAVEREALLGTIKELIEDLNIFLKLSGDKTITFKGVADSRSISQ